MYFFLLQIERSHLRLFIRIKGDIPWPDNIIMHQIIDHNFRAEDVRTEYITEETLVGMNIDKHWTTLKQSVKYQLIGLI